MNYFNIEASFQQKEKRGWDRLYWAIDFHGTIAVADYGDDKKKRQLFPHAKEVLQFLSKTDEICLILFTCSHENNISEMLLFLKEHDIVFDYVNENPECVSTKQANFSRKFYSTTILDDKAGFEGPKDWLIIGEILEQYYGKHIISHI